MSYKVKPLSSSQSYHVDILEPYPAKQAGKDQVSSFLLLQSRVRLFQSYKKYIVTIVQEIEGEEKLFFRLWHANGRNLHSQAIEEFNRIRASLAPLLTRGTVLLTEPFLKRLILPVPISPTEITTRLIDIMDQQPDSQPWLEVIQALKLFNIEHPLPPMDPESQSKCIARVTNKYGSPEQHNVRESMKNLPLVAVPNATDNTVEDTVEDNEKSDQVWESFKQSDFDHKISTWLIDAVKKDRPRSCINLILSRVNTNNQCPSTLDTALHIAVQKGNLTLVKLLLAYQADPTIPNAAGKTPIDIADALKSKNAKNADKIFSALEEMKMLQITARSYFTQNTALLEKRNSSDVFLLSLDGGGMKSIVQCHILAAIDHRINDLCNTCEPLQSHFDYVAGTSAGAIIAAILLYRSTVTVSNAGMYLYKFMNDVFASNKIERSNKLEDYITNAVGENTVMSDLPKGNIVVTATIANIRPSKLHLMTNYGEKRDGLKGPNERKVWEALVASSAAPTYFPPFKCFLDGGLMANNPTLAAMTDIFEQEGKSAKIGFVLSLGTGFLDPPTEVDNFEVYVPGFTLDVLQSLVKSSLGLASLLNHFVEQSTQSDGEVVRQARSWCDSIGANYQRLSPPLKEDAAPDMKSLEELVDILYETEKYILEQHKKIDEIAKIILSK